MYHLSIYIYIYTYVTSHDLVLDFLAYPIVRWGFQVKKCKKKKSTTNKNRPSDALGSYQRDADRRLAAGKQSRSKLGATNFQGLTGRDTVLGGQGIGKCR